MDSLLYNIQMIEVSKKKCLNKYCFNDSNEQ